MRPWASRPLWSDLDALLQAVSARATNLHSSIHGPTHWHSVALAGLHLLGAGERADRPIAFLFALLHDAMRADDGEDPEHGPRAATLAVELRDQGLLEMADSRAERLERALSGHALGATSSDPTIALCWDADRLDIGRVGLAPDPVYFSTAKARALAASGLPLRWARTAPDWHELATRFGL